MNEKLDLKLEELFRWNGMLEIKDREGNTVETLYQRVIGDDDLRKARIAALKSSRELRKVLLDEESDEFMAYIPLEGEKTVDQMIGTLMLGKYHDFRRTALTTTTERKVKEPDEDADLEDHEEYIAELEAAERDFHNEVTEKVIKMQREYIENLQKIDPSKIYQKFVETTIDQMCLTRMNEIFNEYSAYYGTFRDEKFRKRRFSSIDQFRELRSEVKNRIIENYKTLELGIEELKK